MEQQKLIEPIPDNIPGLFSGDVDIFFEKSGKGIREVNYNPNLFEKDQDAPFSLRHVENGRKVEVLPTYEPGSTYLFSQSGIWVDIQSCTLMRLSEIANEYAVRTGVIQTEKGYKHYCPQKMFPAKLLKQQEPGFPFMTDARASYFTKWVDKYGHLDVSRDPWIWMYEFRVNLEKSVVK